jgi:lipoprotein-anchoring transpeptidase ErfK/SrfK
MGTGNNIANAAKTAGWIAALALIAGFSSQAMAQSTRQAAQAPKRIRHVVVVSLEDRKLAVLEDGVVLREFPVAVGATVSPSPVGEFEIVSRVANPTYYHKGTVIEAGPENPLGPRWLGLSVKGYGIHGTNAPHSIGKAASHGCIRLNNHDIVELYPLLAVGDAVEIIPQRNQLTAQLFGNDAPATVAQAHFIPAGQSGGR